LKKNKMDNEILTTVDLIKAMKEGSIGDKIKTLKDIGILLEDNQLSPKYKKWKNLSRTCSYNS